MFAPRLPTTPTSTMATVTLGYIDNLWYASSDLTDCAQQWYMRLT
jgi:hypothetical protein